MPLSKHLARGLRAYIQTDCPSHWLFNGNSAHGEIIAYSQRGVQWVVREARKAAGLHKDATAHTLRHTYATHLLEDGWTLSASKNYWGMLT